MGVVARAKAGRMRGIRRVGQGAEQVERSSTKFERRSPLRRNHPGTF
jgi:hypothetical protein